MLNFLTAVLRHRFNFHAYPLSPHEIEQKSERKINALAANSTPRHQREFTNAWHSHGTDTLSSLSPEVKSD